MRMIAALIWAGWMYAGEVHAWAQGPEKSAGAPSAQAPAAKADDRAAQTTARTKKAKALEKKLPKPVVEGKPNFDLSAARQDRLKKFLPNSGAALIQREAYNIVALGDGVFDLWKDETAAAGQTSTAKAASQLPFPAAFAKELAAQFFYTGGVYEVGTERRNLGPAIGLRQLARAGGSVLDAPRILATTARQSPVNLVLLCYGQGEAVAGMSPVNFTHAVQDALEAAKAMSADVILCAPWLPVAERAETQMGAVRPLTDALREIAQQEGVLFVDLGDLSHMVVAEPTKADEGRVFDGIERTYKGFFHADDSGRSAPRAALHEQLGHLILRTLLDGTQEAPWRLSHPFATQTEAEHLALEFAIENTTEKDMEATVLPLIAGGWKPLDTTPLISLAAGARQVVKVAYGRVGAEAVPVQEAMVRMPMLITAGAQARVQDLRAAVQPLAVVWSLETLFNQEGSFSVGCKVVNSSTRSVKGTWQAEFAGKKLAGQFDLKPAAGLPLDLHFDLPQGGPAGQVLPLSLTVNADGGVHLAARRQVEIVRNLGLTQPIPLRALDGSETGRDEVTLKVSAAEKQLTLACTLAKADILNDAPADGRPAWQLEVNLDARSYGKRLERGSTATLLATGSSAEGAGMVHDIAPWCFGNDYGKVFDPKEFKAALSTTADGSRQITFTIPRSYLYLHEWALNNGNSQMGLNVRLTFHHTPLGAPPGLTTYGVTVNANPTEDVESVAVLELTPKPTQRATVSVY